MKNKNTQKLTLAAMVAAAYAVLSLLGAVFGITYGPIQVRFSEALCLLPFLFPGPAPIQINRINRPAAPMGGRFLMESVRYCPG